MLIDLFKKSLLRAIFSLIDHSATTNNHVNASSIDQNEKKNEYKLDILGSY